jgi:hypothetical protein
MTAGEKLEEEADRLWKAESPNPSLHEPVQRAAAVRNPPDPNGTAQADARWTFIVFQLPPWLFWRFGSTANLQTQDDWDWSIMKFL